jgi:hypothetical protein
MTIIQIRRVFAALYPKWANVEANENLAMEACGNRESVHIGNEIEKLGAAGKLAVSQNYSDAYQTFFQKHPEFALEANMALLDGVLVRFCEPITAANLEELLNPKNSRNVLGRLSETAEARQAQVESRETERMISQITAYMLDANGQIKREYTRRQYSDKIAALRAMPFSQLVARHDEVIAARQLRKTPVEELRAVVKTDAARQRQALHERYEKLPPTYVPPGRELGVPWSFALFKRLPSMEQRRLLDHFGNDQITAACAARGN